MMVRIRLTLLSLAALALGVVATHAQTLPQPKAVLELFTSQGCSSCPAADALFVELAKNPDVIALTLPVTYWDYLGWKDTLGQDAFTKRQKHYAKVRGDGQIYTPQVVVNGVTHAVGSNKTDIDRNMRMQSQDGLIASVALSETDDALKIAVAPLAGLAGKDAGIWVLALSRLVTVPIGRGENEGRTVTYANVVRGMVRAGDWNGKDAVLSVPLSATRAPGADSYVVLVQAEQAGRFGMMPAAILGAAKSR